MSLHNAILAAHAAGDHRGLVTLYRQAAEGAVGAKETGFFLTQAYVFALETGHSDAPELHQALCGLGREA